MLMNGPTGRFDEGRTESTRRRAGGGELAQTHTELCLNCGAPKATPGDTGNGACSRTAPRLDVGGAKAEQPPAEPLAGENLASVTHEADSDRALWNDADFARISQSAGLHAGTHDARSATRRPGPAVSRRPRRRLLRGTVVLSLILVAGIAGWTSARWQSATVDLSASTAAPQDLATERGMLAKLPPDIRNGLALLSGGPRPDKTGDATGARPRQATPVIALATTEQQKWSVEDVQRALAQHGYYRGDVDGKLGPMTRRAVRAFQEDQGLKATGRIAPEVTRALTERLASPEPPPDKEGSGPSP